MTVLLRSLLFLSLFMLFALETHASQQTHKGIDVELVLAVDVSGSIDSDEILLQRKGYQAAFLHPDVMKAIKSGFYGRIAVTYVEWADEGRQKVTIPWTIIENNKDAANFANKLVNAKITRMLRTSIGDALLFAASLFEKNSYHGIRRVIDISGDGMNNQGKSVVAARDLVTSQGIIINGLPILLKDSVRYNFYGPEKLDLYYEDCVIGGPGSFIVPVKAQNEFVGAIRKKIILEIANSKPKVMKAQLWYKPQPRVPCHQQE